MIVMMRMLVLESWVARKWGERKLKQLSWVQSPLLLERFFFCNLNDGLLLERRDFLGIWMTDYKEKIFLEFGFYLFIYLLEKFVWHHTSLNFVHTKKSPQTACRETPWGFPTQASLANASFVLRSLWDIEPCCTSKRDRCALAQIWGELDPQPQLHGGQRTPP